MTAAAGCGVVYGVTGADWAGETLSSIASIKAQMPELPVELHLDAATLEALDPAFVQSNVDHVQVHRNFEHVRAVKFEALGSDRFDRTLYLDGDTFVADSIGELFELMDVFDLAAMPAPQRIHPRFAESGLDRLFPSVPSSFPEYNGGVIVFRRSPAFESCLAEWIRLYDLGRTERDYHMDQASLRVALYHGEPRIAALSPEYNFRAGIPNVVKGRVKIIHAHGNLPEIARRANAQTRGRALPAYSALLSGPPDS